MAPGALETNDVEQQIQDREDQEEQRLSVVRDTNPLLSSLSEAELLALQLDIESRVGLLQQSEPEPEPEPELSEPVRYVCVYRSVIRHGFAMNSKQQGLSIGIITG